MNSAVELGRSFIRTEYQRKYNCPGLIRRAIGELISGRPDPYILFGPVSISKEYQSLSIMPLW